MQIFPYCINRPDMISIHCSFLKIYVLHLKIRIEERERGRKREMASICWLTPEMVSAREPLLLLGVPHACWAPALGPAFAAFSDTGERLRSGAAGTQNSPIWDTDTTGRGVARTPPHWPQ